MLVQFVSTSQKTIILANISFNSENEMCLNMCGLGGVVVRRWAHNPRVVGSKPALATFEESVLEPDVNTNVPLSTKEYKWVPGP